MKYKLKHKACYLFCMATITACSGGGNSSNSNGNNTESIPAVPQGTWSQHSVGELSGGISYLNDISYITAYNDQFAVAGIDGTSPVIIKCLGADADNFYLCGNYTDAKVGAVTAIVALEFDQKQNLVGTFEVPDGYKPDSTSIFYRALTMKLPNDSNVWLGVASTNGVALGLDVNSIGTLVSTSFNGGGSVGIYSTQGVKVTSAQNYTAQGFSSVISDGKGKTYVAGLGQPDNQGNIYSHVWNWDYTESDSAKAFSLINSVESQFSVIQSVISNGNGILYIAGQDPMFNTHVWQYDGNQLKDLNFPGYQVQSLAFMSYASSGYLITGGTSAPHTGQVWSYNLQAESWSSLELPCSNGSGDKKSCSRVVNNVTVDPVNNKLYASGLDYRGIIRIWTFFK